MYKLILILALFLASCASPVNKVLKELELEKTHSGKAVEYLFKYYYEIGMTVGMTEEQATMFAMEQVTVDLDELIEYNKTSL